MITHNLKPHFHCNRSPGISLAEILISLAIFSTAMVGMYMSMNGVNSMLAESMKRDVESAYANMLMAEVNPYDRLVESAYDRDSTEASCGNQRCEVPGLPGGSKLYYTRVVDSDPMAADVKRITVYLYKQPSGGTPFRKYKREIAPKRINYFLTCEGAIAGVKEIHKSPSGEVWIRMDRLDGYYLKHATYGNVAGVCQGAQCESGSTPSCANHSADPIAGVMEYKNSQPPYNNIKFELPFQHMIGGSEQFHFKFPATQGQQYLIQIGAQENDLAANTSNARRVWDLEINDNPVDTVEPLVETNEEYRTAFVKGYTATPMLDTSGVYVLKVEFKDHLGNTRDPRIYNISIERL